MKKKTKQAKPNFDVPVFLFFTPRRSARAIMAMLREHEARREAQKRQDRSDEENPCIT